MHVMKRIKKLIAAWTITRNDPTAELRGAHERMTRHLADAMAGKPHASRDLALFDDLFMDAIELAAPKVDKGPQEEQKS